MLEPHKGKSKKFYLPWNGPFEVLSRTSEVTYKICKRGNKEKWQKVHFNCLKLYGDSEVRHPFRHKNRPFPIYEESPNDMKTEEENEDHPFHVFKPTATESQAARNKPKLSFRRIPQILEQGSEPETENASRDENIERHTPPHLTTFERIPGEHSKNSKGEQISVRNDEPERPLDTGHNSKNESQQDSDVPRGRERRVRRPPVRFAIDEINNKNKY